MKTAQKNKNKEAAIKADGRPSPLHDSNLYQAIAEKAHELYNQKGRRHGHDLEDWLEAERLVLSEKKASSFSGSLQSVPPSKKNN
jgi:hypothetical protein